MRVKIFIFFVLLLLSERALGMSLVALVGSNVLSVSAVDAVLVVALVAGIVLFFIYFHKTLKLKKKLRNELGFTKQVISSIDGVVALIDKKGNFIELLADTIWNMVSNEELYSIGRYVKDHDDLAACYQMIERVSATHNTERIKVGVDVLGKNYVVNVSVVSYDNQRLLLCMTDITDVEKQREKEAKYFEMINTVLQGLPVAIAVKDVTTRKYLIVNRMIAMVWNLDLEHLVGHKLDELFNTPAVAQIDKLEESALHDSSGVASGIVVTSSVFLLCTKQILMLEDGKKWIVSTATDVSSLVQKEKAIPKLNQELIMIQKSLKLATWNIDVEREYLTMNLSMFGLLNTVFSKDELTIPLEFFTKKVVVSSYLYPISRAYLKLINGEVDSLKEDVEIITSPDHTEWVEVCGIVTERNAEGKATCVIGVARDINDRKIKEATLKEDFIHAKEENSQKSAFLANMGHEIRTPLNAIVGFSEIIAEVDDREERKSYLEIIKENNNTLLRLVNDIFDISKIEAGVLDISYTDVDINQMYDNLNYIFSMKMSSKVKFIVEKGLEHCVISTDQGRLNQAISNFITNAVKFTAEGSITAGYKLEGKNCIKFYVKDTGCGLTPEQQQAIFGRFVRYDKAKSGTGLGLAISEMIVNLMGGKIGVDSEVGKGSTFWINLPYKTNVSTTTDPISVESSSEKPAQIPRKLHILVAEDNASNYQLISSVLKKYDLRHAWNGAEAVEMFKAHNPDIILMDIKMPVMDGFEATDKIRKISPTVPIVAVTAYASLEDQQKFQEHNFSGFVAKPIKFDLLKQVMRDALNLVGGGGATYVKKTK